MTVRSTRARLADPRGYALVTACFLLLILLTIGTAGFVYTTLDLRSTAHYDTGNRAFGAAEAGVLHALSTMNEIGAIDFKKDIADRWGSLYGSAQRSIPSLPSLSYEVAVAADPADPTAEGTITATGFAPLEARRGIVVRVRRGNFIGAPGAIYLAADAVSSQFSGNAFEVDGNDHDLFGNVVPTGPVKPGISTRNDAVSNAVTNSLNTAQKDNVKGLGFSLDPLTPSVLPTGGPDLDDLDQIVNHLMSLPGALATSQSKFNGNSTFGTPSAPQVTRMTNKDVTLNGNASGAGILIVDGSLTVSGSLDFIGWIIVRGDTVINPIASPDDTTTVLGNATIMGSLWTGNLNIKVGGSAIVDYCDACMRLVDDMGGGAPLVPRPMRILSWQEVL